MSEKFLEKVKWAFNSILSEEETPKRIEVIEEAKELPSPQARISLNDNFLDELDKLIEKYLVNTLTITLLALL